jgi:hypothetical protein
MKMNSNLPGIGTSCAEVVNIDTIGFWVLADGQEYFVPFSDYPAFRAATVAQIFNVQCLSPWQLYWPDIDADVELDALEHPEQYPLGWKE